MKIPIVSERTDEVRVSFRHILERDGKNRPFTEATVSWINKESRTTSATSLDKESIEESYKGLAIVHPNDVPVKKVGRKIALARALQAAGLMRGERRQVWIGLLEKGMRV